MISYGSFEESRQSKVFTVGRLRIQLYDTTSPRLMVSKHARKPLMEMKIAESLAGH
jgi:hypothetical protein